MGKFDQIARSRIPAEIFVSDPWSISFLLPGSIVPRSTMYYHQCVDHPIYIIPCALIEPDTMVLWTLVFSLSLLEDSIDSVYSIHHMAGLLSMSKSASATWVLGRRIFQAIRAFHPRRVRLPFRSLPRSEPNASGALCGARLFFSNT